MFFPRFRKEFKAEVCPTAYLKTAAQQMKSESNVKKYQTHCNRIVMLILQPVQVSIIAFSLHSAGVGCSFSTKI